MVKGIHPRTIKTLKEVLDDSHKGNPVLFAILSAILASIGLATNSQTTILGSMLFSPIGSLINKSNIYHFLRTNNIRTRKKYKHWIKPLMVVISITIMISFLFSKMFSTYKNPFTNRKLNENWPTTEMKERANPINALYMIIIALVCGIALPLSIIFNNNIRVVAIGIATALIPPLANIGLALGTFGLEGHREYSTNAIITGAGIFLINLILLWLPSRYLLEVFSRKNNVFKRLEKIFNI